jgi:hypothetical protein
MNTNKTEKSFLDRRTGLTGAVSESGVLSGTLRSSSAL